MSNQANTAQILAHAIPSPRIVPAPAPDAGLPRSRCVVLPSPYGHSGGAVGPGWLLSVASDGDVEVHLDNGWHGWVYHKLVRR